MIRRLLIANRGEIAVRIARGARELGIVPLGVYSEADEHAYHRDFMDESICIGPAPAVDSYLNADAILGAAKTLRADAVHPGYGFLSERADFARAVRDAGLTFVGPPPEAMAAMGSKIEAKRLVREFDVPVVPGYDGENQDPKHLQKEAERAGFPLLIKASAGGGGRGMRVVNRSEEFVEALASAKREAAAAFGSDVVLLERYLQRPRHIEFQILADAHGRIIHLGERECSIQRRHQKIVEEAPSVALSEALRAEMGAAAVRAAKAAGYVNAGTAEFMLDADAKYYFLEMNARLQVEHPVTELVYGIDLVHWQLRIASGEALTIAQEDVRPRGWAIETRIYAEDPANQMRPSIGTITRWAPPEGPGIRVDSGVQTGSEVSVHYDPMLAKLIVWSASRSGAVERLTCALEDFRIDGVRANVPLLLWIARDEAYRAGDVTTGFLAERLDESQFAQPNVEPGDVLAAAAELLRSGRAPWRLGGIGIPLRLQIGEETFSLIADRHAGGGWRISGDVTGVIAERRNERKPAVEFTYGAPPSSEASGSGARAGATGGVRSPMPGKIVKVAVREGDSVAMHDLLLVLEAMKMEHRIEAPDAATVRAVRVREGEIVPAGAALLDLE